MSATAQLLAPVLLAVSLAASAADAVPAILVAPTEPVRAELARAVRDVLGGGPVHLAADALTRESELIVDRAPARDADGRLLDGRAPGRPHHFRLLLRDGRCVLEADGGSPVELAQAHCIALEAAAR